MKIRKTLKHIGSFALCLIMLLSTTPATYAYRAADITQPISGGSDFFGFVDENNDLWMCGKNNCGQLGDGTTTDHDLPVKIMNDVIAIDCSDAKIAVAVQNDGSLWKWGNSPDDGLPISTPQKIMDNVKFAITDSDGFQDYGAAIKEDNSLWMWGNASGGKLGVDINLIAPNATWDGFSIKKENGYDTAYIYMEPTKVMENVKSVSMRRGVVAAVTQEGSLWMWGDNQSSVWGGKYNPIFITDDKYVYTPLKVMENVVSIEFGEYQCSIVKTDGSLWMWGNSYRGATGLINPTVNPDELPDKTFAQQTPIQVMQDVKQVSAYNAHLGILKTDGTLWMCGEDDSNYIGNGPEHIDCVFPMKILENVVYYDAGLETGYAIKSDGSIWVWGNNFEGQLGIGTFNGDRANEDGSLQSFPVQLSNYKTRPPVCEVKLELNGGNGDYTNLCNRNELLTPPSNPERDGFFFAGWFKDKACTKAWNFDTDKITENCTLYAKWLPKSTATVIAEPSSQIVKVDGEEITFNTYILRDDKGYSVNFVKLRDVAYILNGTKAEFNVDYRNNAVRLDARQPYTTQNGAELTIPSVVAAPAKTSITPVLTGGVTAPIEAFLLIDEQGGGHNYFKLRDIGKIAGFNVEWDTKTSQIIITTTKPYSE